MWGRGFSDLTTMHVAHIAFDIQAGTSCNDNVDHKGCGD